MVGQRGLYKAGDCSELGKGRWPGVEKGGSDSGMSTQQKTMAKSETRRQVILKISVVPHHEKCPQGTSDPVYALCGIGSPPRKRWLVGMTIV